MNKIDNTFTAWIDLDDTLWDFKANSRVALADLYDDYALARWFDNKDEWIQCYEKHNHMLWDQYNHALITKEFLMTERFRLPLAEHNSPLTDELSHRFDLEYLDRLAECTRLVDGSLELMIWLRKHNIKIGILSNGFTEVQYRKIKNSGLEQFVDHVVLSDDIGINKPDVRLYRHAEQRGCTEASKCIMIGDNPDTDIAGALNAGWIAILYDPTRDTSKSGNIFTASSLHHVIEHLENGFQNI